MSVELPAPLWGKPAIALPDGNWIWNPVAEFLQGLAHGNDFGGDSVDRLRRKLGQGFPATLCPVSESLISERFYGILGQE